MLTDQQLQDDQRDGFILVEGLISPDEAQTLRTESHDLLARMATPIDPTWESGERLALPDPPAGRPMVARPGRCCPGPAR